jgi:transcriptional regulator NrdR family protein
MANPLQKVVGPECPECGCEASDVVDTRQWRGAVWEVRCCSNCRHEFSQLSEEYQSNVKLKCPDPAKSVVYMYVVQCPNCGNEWPPVTSTLGRGWRRHKCKQCKHTFQSVEKKAPPAAG